VTNTIAYRRAVRADQESERLAAKAVNRGGPRDAVIYRASVVVSTAAHLEQAGSAPKEELEAALRRLGSQAPSSLKNLANAFRALVSRMGTHSRMYSEDFHRALSHLPRCGASPQLSLVTLRVWHELSAHSAPPEPIIEAYEDHTKFAWNLADHYLDLDIFENGTFEWFYRDAMSDEADGSEDPIAELPPPFFARLAAVSKVG